MKRVAMWVSVACGGLVLAALASIGGSAPAQAFPAVQYWHMPASGPAGVNRAGAEGIYGTGGRSDYGIQCAHCHIGAAGMIDVQVTAMPPFATQGNDQTYSPGQLYDIQVTLLNEHLWINMPMGNNNGFAATFEDPGGVIMGALFDDAGNTSTNCPAAAPVPPPVSTTYVWGDCHGVVYNHADMVFNVTAWSFQWQAPAVGAGEVTMWYGVVDGDGKETGLDDDVKQGNMRLLEGS